VGPKPGKHDKVVEKATFEPRCKFAREVNILANQRKWTILKEIQVIPVGYNPNQIERNKVHSVNRLKLVLEKGPSRKPENS